MRTGISVQRQIIGGPGATAIGEQHRQNTNHGQSPTFFRAVVVDIICDPRSLTTEEKTSLKEQVSNPEFVDTMPMDSILGRIITNSHDLTDSTPTIIYPFYQSHISLPIQVGEQVCVIYEDYYNNGTALGRWISRLRENENTEDLNYTHSDRRFDPSSFQTTRTSEQGSNSQSTVPSFPNGGGTPSTYSLRQNSNQNAYTEIISNITSSYSQGTYEPVPRFTRRPQEFILQGMNNSLICLGQDRHGPADRPNNTDEKLSNAGMIDLVVGRGRFPLRDNDRTAPTNKPTSPLVVRNTRQNLEVDKRATTNKNVKEGDPDFQRDAARIYVAQQSLADNHFKLSNTKIQYPDNTINFEQDTGTNISYVVQKADNIRLIARKETDPENIKGTILILKEGTKDEDMAFFIINKDGKINIESKEMYFGKSIQKEQPWLYYTEYKKAIEALQQRVKDLESFSAELCQKLAISFAAATSVPYAPIAAFNSQASQIGALSNQKLTHISNDSDIQHSVDKNNHSKKIFGE